VAVEQRMDDDRVCAFRRTLDPEALEVREFLALRLGGLQRQSARRQAVDLPFGDRAEIACAEENADLVEIIRLVDRSMEAEAGKAKIVLDLRCRLVAECEHGG